MNQKQNFFTANETEDVREILCPTEEQAEDLEVLACGAIRAVIKGEPASNFVQRFGRVVRLPEWFRVSLQ